MEDGPRQAAIDLLEDLREFGPTLALAIQLRAHKDVWRARFHNDRYRMIYQDARGEKRIIVKRIRVRASAYKSMKN